MVFAMRSARQLQLFHGYHDDANTRILSDTNQELPSLSHPPNAPSIIL